MPALKVLEAFKEKRSPIALVIDEYGGVQSLVTITDILESIVGDILLTEAEVNPEAVQREDGSWLLGGALPIGEFKDLLDLDELPDEGSCQTVGGFIMTALGRIPKAGDHVEQSGLRFEVVDMDGLRVDQVLAIPVSKRIYTLDPRIRGLLRPGPPATGVGQRIPRDQESKNLISRTRRPAL